MIPFSFEKVRTEQDAIQAAAAGGRYIAGGTTLIDLMREEVERPERLIDINALPLGGIRVEGSDLVIGALARMADVAAHPDTLLLQPLIAETLIEGASPQLRNMASIGGNLMQRVRCPYFRMLDAACNKRDPGSGCSAIDGINGSSAILGTSDHCVATHPSDLAVSLVALDATCGAGPAGGALISSRGALPAAGHHAAPRTYASSRRADRRGSRAGRSAMLVARAISKCATARPTSSRSSRRLRRSTSRAA